MSEIIKESINIEKVVIDILGVKFDADIYHCGDTHILTLCPQGKWSLVKSISSVKVISVCMRSR
jgi:hypothetical protein